AHCTLSADSASACAAAEVFAAADRDAIGGLLGGVGHLTLWLCNDDVHWSLLLVTWLFLGLPPVAQLLNLIRHCNDVVARFVVVTQVGGEASNLICLVAIRGVRRLQ